MGRKRQDNAGSESMPETPESGWAWVVLGSGFVATFMVVGFLSSMSVYVYVWIHVFEGSAAETSLVISLCSFMVGLMSPVAGSTCKRFGPRATTMAGGTLMGAGILISSQATGIVFLILSLGFFTAFGMSMVLNASFMALGMYFKKRLALAMGLATAGTSVGQLALPPFLQYLIDQHGWRGSLMISSALVLHALAAGALMRPLVPPKQKRSSKKSRGCVLEDKTTENKSGKNCESTGVGTDRGLSFLNLSVFGAEDLGGSPSGVALGEGSIFEEEPDVTMTSEVELEDEDRIQYVDGDSWSQLSTPEGDMSAMSHGVWLPVAVTALQSMPGKRRQESFLPKRKPRSASMLSQTLEKQSSDLSRLLRNPSFLVMLAVSLAHGFSWASTIYHMVSRAESIGIEADNAALLVTLMGAGSLVGRLLIGLLLDRKWLPPEICYVCAFTVCALTTFITPLVTAFKALVAVTLVHGISNGAATVVIATMPRLVVKSLLGTTSMAYSLLATGVGEISGGALAGWFYDALDSYDYSFYTAGSVMTAGSGLMLILHFLQRAKQRHNGFPAQISDGRDGRVQPGSNPSDPELGGSKLDDLGSVNPVFFMREGVDLEMTKC